MEGVQKKGNSRGKGHADRETKHAKRDGLHKIFFLRLTQLIHI